jgi:hypothetical protein
MHERAGRKPNRTRRRARAAELAEQGTSTRQAETILREEGFVHTDHNTLARDLRREREQLAANAQRTTAEHRDAQHAKLLVLERFVAEQANMDDPDMVLALLSIHDRIAKLCGLNLERTALNVAVNVDQDPAKMGLYHRFLHETRFIPEAKYDAIWKLCRELAEPPTAERTARIVPPEDSPLWREEGPLALTEGDSTRDLDRDDAKVSPE